MNIYIILIFLCVILSFIEIIPNRVNKKGPIIKLCLIVIFSLMFFIAGFREVGYDYCSYKDIYVESLYVDSFLLSTILGIEPGYFLLNKISPSYEYLIILVSLICLWLLWNNVTKYSKLPIVSTLSYIGIMFFVGVMGQMRQAIAVLICISALMNISQGKFRFCATVLIASTFHISALFTLLALFVPNEFKSLKFYIFSLILAFIIYLIGRDLYIQIINFLPPFVRGKVMYYQQIETSDIGLNITIVIRSFIFFLAFYVKKNMCFYKEIAFISNCYFLSLFLYIILGFAPSLAGRGLTYFAILEIFLCANIIYSLRGYNRVFFYTLFVSFALYRAIQAIYIPVPSENNIDFLPYSNWLF